MLLLYCIKVMKWWIYIDRACACALFCAQIRPQKAHKTPKRILCGNMDALPYKMRRYRRLTA